VNIAQQFKAHYEGNDYELFKHISEINPEPYTAFFSTPQYVLSLYSPECFMKITERRIISRPIKGTRPRSIDPIKDHQLAQELLQSQKDEAELLMIVDLVRNDLGKVCQYGSVHVTELNRLETHPHVHHLVATVEGTLNEGCHHLDALKALFPGGSITGAPKKRSMEIIHEIEPDRRNIYTGAFGYVGFNQRTELAMIIRNLMRVENTLTFYAGSGIVADSEPLAEYEETLEKAKHIFTFLDPNNGEKTIFTR
ncbi:MAG: anthranilate synthase component I family protein, partial [Chlamydiota bacterium]|nr:anthranilate synthase component I family protein [Chlamydiota bacterium]